MHIKRGDEVVLTKYVTERENLSQAKGHRSTVLDVQPKKNRVVVQGVNYRYKHVRRSQQNPQGGRIEKEMPIHISNVMLYCPKCDRGVRVRKERIERVRPDGKTIKEVVRICKRCGETLGASE